MRIKVSFNNTFRDVHKSRCRYIAMKGSAGSGKSVDTAQMYILRLLKDKGRNLLCVRKIEQSNRNSTFAELISAIDRLGVNKYFAYTKSPMKIQCINGNCVMFAGMNDDRQREKLKSVTFEKGKLTDVWIEEATELSKEDFEIIDDRLRGKLPRGIFYQIKLTFNPVSDKHWIKRMFFDIKDENVLTHHSTYRDNRFIDSDYYMRMERRKLTDPDGYRVYGLGEWGETEGVIFSNYVIEKTNSDLLYYDNISMGQDFGFNHANCILLVGMKDDELYVIKELYVKELDSSEIISISEGEFPKDVTMYADCAEPDRIRMWRKAGYRVIPSDKNTRYFKRSSVLDQIDFLKRHKIHIDESCRGLISEIEVYRWEYDSVKGEYTDTPQTGFDDAIAALRYAVQPFRFADFKRKEQPKDICTDKTVRAVERSKKEILKRNKRRNIW